jgi:hypothetical protein
VTCAARGADHAYPSGAPDDIPGFCEVHTASVLCLWRSCSILFICFVLVISIVSFCTISVLSYFWNYDVLDYSACCFGIRLSMFVQHFTKPGSNSSFNVSSIEKGRMLGNAMIVPVYHQKKRQKLHQLTTKSNDRRSPHGSYLIFSIQ